MKKIWIILNFILIFLVSYSKDSLENSVYKTENSVKAIENLKVIKVSNSSVDLKWEKLDEATEFDIYRAIDKKNYVRIGITKELGYHDSGLEPNTRYSYYIFSKVDGTYNGVIGNKVNVMTVSSGEMEIPEIVKTFYSEELENILISSSKNCIVLKKNEKTKNIKIGDWLFGEWSPKLVEIIRYEVLNVREEETSLIIETKKLDLDKVMELYKNVKVNY